jgi:hypothetical protein
MNHHLTQFIQVSILLKSINSMKFLQIFVDNYFLFFAKKKHLQIKGKCVILYKLFAGFFTKKERYF